MKNSPKHWIYALICLAVLLSLALPERAGAAISLGDAVDNTALAWTTGGNLGWSGQSTVSNDGTDAAQTGTITHNQSTWIEATVTGPGVLTFYWKVSSESNVDYLRFYIDGMEQSGSISGETYWSKQTFLISSGTHTLKWAYMKDLDGSSGSDAGWLDNVVYTQDTTVPSTTAYPAGGTYITSQTITLTCDDGSGSGCDKIYYTTDGSTPSTSSKYAISPIIISSNTTLKYFAVDKVGNMAAPNTELYIITGGSLQTWGANYYGQLGNGETGYKLQPVQVPGLAGIVAIEGGDLYSIALKNDGTVWSWGQNNNGQLGDGTTTDRSIPVQVPGLSNVSAIAASLMYEGVYNHSMALKNDGTVWTWGYNSNGQLGDGTTTDRSTPVQVSGLTGITAIAAGSSYSMALKNDGTVWAWGSNYVGQLGDGTTTNSTTPVQVSGLTDVMAIAAGNYRSIAIKSDGTVWAWGGSGDWGGWGNTISIYGLTPVQVSGLTGITAIAAGYAHFLALKNDGTAWAWGYNYDGQLGDGTTTTSSPYGKTTPVQVSDLTGISAIAAGFYHSLALKNDGTAWAWGGNYYGQLGDGTATNYSKTTPVQVAGLSDAATIAAGYHHTIALKSDGTVWTWGANDYGQLGNGLPTYSSTSINIAGLTGVVATAGGFSHTMALKSDGSVWAWGKNSTGQLGDGTDISTTAKASPVQVSDLTGVTAIAGGYHSLALKNDGTVWAWGANWYGQLGDGTTTGRTTPVQVAGLTGITAVAAYGYYSLALKHDGTVWVWGDDESYGAGGNSTPIQLSSLTDVVSIAAGGSAIFLKSNGSVQTWDWKTSSSPVSVRWLSGVAAIAAGDNHLMALESDGTVHTWGENDYGQLGNGTTTDSSYPFQVTGLAGIISIAAGNAYSLALKNDGTLWVWGKNDVGELGDGTTKNRTIPVQATALTGVVGVAAGYSHSVAIAASLTAFPTGSMSINNNADYATSDSVALNLSATDDTGITGYYISESSTTPSTFSSGWISVSSTTSYIADASYTLSSGDGTKTVYVWYRDAAGNVSSIASDSIVLDTTAPDTSVTAQPSNPTNSITASFSFTSTEAGSTFECQIDSGGYTICTSPKSYSSLSAGSHTFYVKTTDPAGSTDATPASYIWTIDTTAPAVTINAATSPTDTTSQTITGTVEAGATVNVATDTAASDGAAIVTGTTWSYTITGLAAGANNITVTATDSAGNTANAMSAIALDTTTPVFSSTSPSSDSVINTATVGYLLSEAVASGSITFTRIGGTADSASHLYNFTSSDITAGTHSINTSLVLVNGAIYTVTFEATDAAGNTGSVSSTNVTYDTTSASVTITSPAANSVTNNAQVTYTLSEDISAGDIVFTRTGGASDSMSPYTYTLSASERTVGSHTVDTGLSLRDGAYYTVSIENVTDAVGNATVTVSNSNVKYDITAVAITSTTPASNSIITTATVSYTLSEQAQSGKITLTRTSGSADSSSPHLYDLTASDLTAGSHTINTNLTLVDGAFYTVSFDATDLVGNAATTVSNAMVYYESAYDPGSAAEGNVDNTGASASRVDGFDLIKLSLAFGSRPGDANWNPACDLDGNGKVDGSDLIVLGNHFGEVQ